ncbi:hypothetical protein ACE2AJ_05015 [Aquihabitans daechungensis]|uniref:AMIN-like domain-containing (lipo)protein n=1 Tax=Aquihabitans daechungensis TaxID=1052257 RepID=UPI003BA14BBF
MHLFPSPCPSARPRRSLLLAIACTALAAFGATACDPLPPAPPGGVAADCRDVAWGSGAKRAERMTSAEITRIRTGSHRCFDRMVVDLRGAPAAGWRVRYHAVSQEGSGTPVPLRGNADLEVVALAPAYAVNGSSSFHPPNPREAANVAGYRSFRQIAFAGSFEGQTTFGIGVRTRLPFRVFAVSGPNGRKLVVDVAHRWP